MLLRFSIPGTIGVGLLLCMGWSLSAQDSEPPSDQPAPQPEIRDQPETVDPSQLLPAAVQTNVRIEFPRSSLGEVVRWLRDDVGLAVVLKQLSLSEAGILSSEPVSDRLDDEPVHVLLDRLQMIGVGWYFENEIIYLTSLDEVRERSTTRTYTIGDLLDDEFQGAALGAALESTIAPDTWRDQAGVGTFSFLGDVMFVRQSDDVHREVQGLLSALRNHGRRTFIHDSPRHAKFRERLREPITVAFDDTPLETAVRELAEETELDIRLDLRALRDARVREREPISLRLEERPLHTVIEAITTNLNLASILRDGVLWLTSDMVSREFQKTAVFDVRDLCRNASESDALIEAILSQTDISLWIEGGGEGMLEAVRPGTFVIRAEERVLDEVLQLLEAYRTALRSSKLLDRDALDPDEVITVYYRMHSQVAEDLERLLPKLVFPETWISEAESHTDEKAHGRILRVASPPDWEAAATSGIARGDATRELTLMAERAVLIVTQTRAAHEEVAKIIQRVQTGDPSPSSYMEQTGMGGMGGMGGFGGGYFSIPTQP